MASRRLLIQLGSIYLIYTMLALLGISEAATHEPAPSPHVHSPVPAPSNTGSTGGGTGAAADCPSHLFAMTVLASLAFLLPFYLSVFY